MVKKKWKTLLVALTILLGTVLTVGRPTVVQASETGALQKRSSGIQFHAEFRHANAAKNTWTDDNHIYIINGEDVFCLDPTTAAQAGAKYVGKVLDKQGYTNVQQSSRVITLTPASKERLMLLSFFGYLINPTPKAYHYTQFMIWEEMGYAIQKVNGGLSMAEYQAFKASVNTRVNGYKHLTSWDGTTHTVKVGETLTLVDTNNVVQNLNIPVQLNGFKIAINDNVLTLTPTINATNGELRFKQNPNEKIHGASIVFTSPGSQTLGKLKLNDPQNGKVTINVIKNAKVKVVKTDLSNGQALEEVTFGLYDKTTNQLVKSAKTNAKGIVEFDITEPARSFYIKETQAKQGYFLNTQRFDVTVKAGETQTINVTNEPVPTIVTEATGRKGGKKAFGYETHIEKATMERLVIGQTYKAIATQYNLATGAVLGKQEKAFKASKTSETLTFEFNVPANYEGDIVYGEDLYRNGEKVAVHFDLTNKKQTVTVKVPKVVTEATTTKGAKQGFFYEKHKEVFTASDLIVGRTYTAVAFQYGFDGEVLAKQTRDFVAKDTTHSETFEFSVPVAYFGKVVYGEELYEGGKKVAVHFDFKNKNQTVEVVKPKVQTTMVEANTTDSEINPMAKVRLEDFVSYDNLIVGQRYTVAGALMDKATSKPLLDEKKQPVTGETTFTAHQAKGVVSVMFEVLASALRGKSIVAFESLKHNGIEVANHADMKDKNQTVTVTNPKVQTTLMEHDTTNKTVHALTSVTLKDVVKVTDLVVGREYTVTGTLNVKETNRPLMDKAGKVVTAITTFTATAKDMSVDVVFKDVDVSSLVGQTVVAFETLQRDGVILATHADINDKNQSIPVKDVRVGTKASVNGQHIVVTNGIVTLTDEVSYTGLIASETYTVKGILMDKATGKPLLIDGVEVRAEKTFTAETTDGTVSLDFVFNARGLDGDVVVFEEMFHRGQLIGKHQDINDKRQTVTIKPPQPELPVTGFLDTAMNTIMGAGLISLAYFIYRAPKNKVKSSKYYSSR